MRFLSVLMILAPCSVLAQPRWTPPAETDPPVPVAATAPSVMARGTSGYVALSLRDERLIATALDDEGAAREPLGHVVGETREVFAIASDGERFLAVCARPDGAQPRPRWAAAAK